MGIRSPNQKIMARVNGNEWLTKWGTNLNNSGTYIKNGVNRVTVAPGQSAAAAQDRLVAGFNAAVTSGKWARNVSAVSLQSWQSAMIDKGIGRISAGVTQAQKTKVDKITRLLANVDGAAAAANALPKGGLAQGIARATAFMQKMSELSASS